MPFAPFHELFREIAERETRSVTMWGDPELPDGSSYGFLELFCDEKDCDCRRAFIWVISPQVRTNGRRPLATISYGWEDEAFYRDWASFPLSDEDLHELKGPALVRLTPQSDYAPRLLRLFESVLDDEAYAERIVRHYRMFREAIDEGAKTSAPATRAPRLAPKIPSRRRSKKKKRRR